MNMTPRKRSRSTRGKNAGQQLRRRELSVARHEVIVRLRKEEVPELVSFHAAHTSTVASGEDGLTSPDTMITNRALV